MTKKIEPVTAWAVVREKDNAIDLYDIYYLELAAKETRDYYNSCFFLQSGVSRKVIKVLISPVEE